jgi:hypothetical protein
LVAFKEKKALGTDVLVACYELVAKSRLLYQHGYSELLDFEDIFHLFIDLSMLRASWRPFALLSSSTDPYVSLLFNVLELA